MVSSISLTTKSWQQWMTGCLFGLWHLLNGSLGAFKEELENKFCSLRLLMNRGLYIPHIKLHYMTLGTETFNKHHQHLKSLTMIFRW